MNGSEKDIDSIIKRRRVRNGRKTY